MSRIEIHLDVASVAALGRHMPPRESGFLVPSARPLPMGADVELRLRVGGRDVVLAGQIEQTAVPSNRLRPAPHVVRVQLDRPSWKRLFLMVCRGNWRRTEDLDGDVARARHVIATPPVCLVDAAGQLHEVKLVEVSRAGAFLATPSLEAASGDVLRFRAGHAMSWHLAEVRWTGTKHDHQGIGVQLSFDSPEEQQAWQGVLTAAQHAAGS